MNSDMDYGDRPPSEQLADLHVYIVPTEMWRSHLNSAVNQIINDTISAGFIRVSPDLSLDGLRQEALDQLGMGALPQDFIFLRSVGRCFTKVQPKQEYILKAKNYLPPQTYTPEIFVLEVTEDDRYSRNTEPPLTHQDRSVQNSSDTTRSYSGGKPGFSNRKRIPPIQNGQSNKRSKKRRLFLALNRPKRRRHPLPSMEWDTQLLESAETESSPATFESPVPPLSLHSYSVLPSPLTSSCRSIHTQTGDQTVATQTPRSAHSTNTVASNPVLPSASVDRLPAVQGTPTQAYQQNPSNPTSRPRHDYGPPHSATPPQSPDLSSAQRRATKQSNPTSGDSGIADMDDNERQRMQDLLRRQHEIDERRRRQLEELDHMTGAMSEEEQQWQAAEKQRWQADRQRWEQEASQLRQGEPQNQDRNHQTYIMSPQHSASQGNQQLSGFPGNNSYQGNPQQMSGINSPQPPGVGYHGNPAQNNGSYGNNLPHGSTFSGNSQGFSQPSAQFGVPQGQSVGQYGGPQGQSAGQYGGPQGQSAGQYGMQGFQQAGMGPQQAGMGPQQAGPGQQAGLGQQGQYAPQGQFGQFNPQGSFPQGMQGQYGPPGQGGQAQQGDYASPGNLGGQMGNQGQYSQGPGFHGNQVGHGQQGYNGNQYNYQGSSGQQGGAGGGATSPGVGAGGVWQAGPGTLQTAGPGGGQSGGSQGGQLGVPSGHSGQLLTEPLYNELRLEIPKSGVSQYSSMASHRTQNNEEPGEAWSEEMTGQNANNQTAGGKQNTDGVQSGDALSEDVPSAGDLHNNVDSNDSIQKRLHDQDYEDDDGEEELEVSKDLAEMTSEEKQQEHARLQEKLELAKSQRREMEKTREELVKRAKQLQNRTQQRRNQARDIWKKKYFEEKKKTQPLEEQSSKLRSELENLHRRIMSHLEGTKGEPARRSDEKPSHTKSGDSPKSNLKIQATKLQHTIEELQRKVDNIKMKLAAEMKLRNQAEGELRALRAELTQKKINVTLTRSQQLAALENTQDSTTPRSNLPTGR